MQAKIIHSWVNSIILSIKFCSVLKWVSFSPMLEVFIIPCHKHSCKKIVLVHIYGKFYAHTYCGLSFWNVFLVQLQTRNLMKVAFIHSRRRNNTMWQITIKKCSSVGKYLILPTEWKTAHRENLCNIYQKF